MIFSLFLESKVCFPPSGLRTSRVLKPILTWNKFAAVSWILKWSYCCEICSHKLPTVLLISSTFVILYETYFSMMVTRSAGFSIIFWLDALFGLLGWTVLSWNFAALNVSDVCRAILIIATGRCLMILISTVPVSLMWRNDSFESVPRLIYELVSHFLSFKNICLLLDLPFRFLFWAILRNLLYHFSTNWSLLTSVLSLSKMMTSKSSDTQFQFWALLSYDT